MCICVVVSGALAPDHTCDGDKYLVLILNIQYPAVPRTNNHVGDGALDGHGRPVLVLVMIVL